MAKRRIRLTESQLTRLIGRIVEESEKEMDSQKTTKKDVENALGAFFSKYEDMLRDDKDEIMAAAREFKSEEMDEKYLQESDDYEEMDDIDSRKSSFREKLMIGGGFTTAALGFLGFIGNIMGWSESKLTTKIHEFTEMFGAGNYMGPITVGMIATGLGIAFRGITKRYDRIGR